MALVFWVTWEKDGEFKTSAVEAENAESAALRLMSDRGVELMSIWNMVEAGTSTSFAVYEKHCKGSLERYDLGTRMLIQQIIHQRSVCETFAHAAKSRNQPYGSRWLPF